MSKIKNFTNEIKQLTYPSLGRLMTNTFIVLLFTTIMGGLIYGIDTLITYIQTLIL